MHRIFPAKLLLFGEYTVLNGSQALAVPLQKWSGQWKLSTKENSDSLDFVDWLFSNKMIDEKTRMRILLDYKAGWNFESTIPYGHGVGSSGAYVAAMYDRYVKENDVVMESASKTMAEMESYFHGTSSGMDPLVSFENKTVLKDAEGKFHLCGNTALPEGFRVFLWDSGIERSTNTLVNIYKQKCKDEIFLTQVNRNLIPMVDHAIHFYLNGSGDMLESCISVISQFQREYFKEMIPDMVKEHWNHCLEKGHTYMKLCGAGGGGYFMIITRDHEEVPVPGAFLIGSNEKEVST